MLEDMFGFRMREDSHGDGGPAGGEAEDKESPGAVRLRGNAVRIQQGSFVGLDGRDGVGGVNYGHHPPLRQTNCQGHYVTFIYNIKMRLKLM